MNWAQLIAATRAALDAARADLARAEAGARSILDRASAQNRTNLTAEEDGEVTTYMSARTAARQRVTEAEARLADYERQQGEDQAATDASEQRNPTPAGELVGAGARSGQGNRDQRVGGGARVTSEERTYSRHKSKLGANNGGASFFRDAYLATERHDWQARERLERHQREMEVEREQGVGAQQRAQTTTTFAGLIVPQYLVDMVALLIRSGRPFANAVTHMELPDEGMQFVIPRGTTGAAVASQTPENTSVQNTDEVWANLTVNVNTIAGQQDVSRQSIERGSPGIDELVYLDLAGAYHAELDRQGLAGTGASNQMLGLQNTSGIYQATAFGAAATATTFWSKMAGIIASIAGTGAGVDPKLIIMHPRRWGWLTSLVDSSGRPLVLPNNQGPFNAIGYNSAPGAYGDENTSAGGAVDTNGVRVVGFMQGLPIITDANVPTSVGTGPEDLVWVVDTTKIILWEDGDGMPTQLRFEQTLGNQLTVKLVVYGYAAFTAGRYPTAVGQIGGNATVGNGLVAPTF